MAFNKLRNSIGRMAERWGEIYSEPTPKILIHTALFVSLYSTVVFAVLQLCRGRGYSPTPNEIIDVCKMVSLFIVVIVGGELLHSARRRISAGGRGLGNLGWVAAINATIYALTLVVLLLLFVKISVFTFPIFVNSEHLAQTRELPDTWGKSLLEKTTYGSMFPIFGYAALNYIVAFLPLRFFGDIEDASAANREKERAVRFFVFSNLTVVVPLLMVIVLINVRDFTMLEKSIREAFLSGAIAIVLFVNAISAKAVEVFRV